jgi:hypothetical protein
MDFFRNIVPLQFRGILNTKQVEFFEDQRISSKQVRDAINIFGGIELK